MPLSLLPMVLLLVAEPPVKTPDALGLPSDVEVSELHFERYGESNFTEVKGPPRREVGQHWWGRLRVPGAKDEKDRAKVWERLAPAMAKAGWETSWAQDKNPFMAVLRRTVDGHPAHLEVDVFGGLDLRVSLIVEGTEPLKHVLAAPAAVPEPVDAKTGDFPWLTLPEGFTFVHGESDPHPLLLKLPGATKVEVVGESSLVKSYRGPRGVSNLDFATGYAAALEAAGWKVLVRSQGLTQTDVTLVAHFDRSKRNLWAVIHFAGDVVLRVADLGAVDLAAALERDCRFVLNGVLFDFDKATLKDESLPVLERVAPLLSTPRAPAVEVGGHTDDVGNDRYNEKLSQARAEMVRSWLAAHGVPAAKLTGRGYGEAHPVEPNDSDEHRAKNRRVEILDPKCHATRTP